MTRIIVDSSSDYPRAEALEKGICVVPLTVTLDGKTYCDGQDLGKDEFFQLMEESDSFPKTSQVSPQAFLDVFKEAKAAGEDVVVITLSSALSGTWQSAQLGKTMADHDGVYIVDSLAASCLIMVMADYALKLSSEGLGAKDIAQALENLKGRVKVAASLDTLEYLHRGGRLPRAAATIGEMAKLKPVIHLTEEGKVGVLGACLGKKKSLDFVMKTLGKATLDPLFPVYTLYTYGTKNCEKLEARLADAGTPSARRLQIGSVIGAHVGPEACGVLYVEA